MRKLPSFSALGLLASIAVACTAPEAGDEAEASTSDLTNIDPKLDQAVFQNLTRLEKEIGAGHLASYGGWGGIVGQFMWALDVEYRESPAMLKRRAEVLASPVYFSMPDVLPDADVGRRTPFHGMDEAAFTTLGANEDFVWQSHRAFNGGSKDGIRPFSVCETKFLIGISKGEIDDPAFTSQKRITSFDPYAKAYAAYAASCSERDLADWYNYRGLGELRPSWLESNYQDRVLRRYATMCKNPPQEWWGRCGEYGQGRAAVRDKKNRAMALRQMAYDPRPESKIGALSDEAYMTSPYNAALILEDRLGDGIGELVTPGPLELLANARFELARGAEKKWVTVTNDKKLVVDGGETLTMASATLTITDKGTFTAQLNASFTFADGTSATATIPPRVVKALLRVDPAWKREWAGAPDMGLLQLFPDGAGCLGNVASPATCPLLKRFTSMLDRHEHFYKTYSSNDEDDPTIISQPSPLVACSVTVNAARAWAWAGTPPGGRAGLIFLMRVPFADILTGDKRSIDTLGRVDPARAPKVLTLEAVYASKRLDIGRIWLDLATLSNDLYATENEISKFGAVPADEIEGILVLGKPGALP